MRPDGNIGKGGAAAPPNLAELLPVCCNVADDVLVANIRASMKREFPVVNFMPGHDGVALLVGGGPSAKDEIAEIAKRQKDGAKIFALNGVSAWLAQQGVIADALVLLDARPHNARFVSEAPKTTVLYLSSQCAPEVFDAADGREVITWHAPTGGLSGVVEERPAAFICGSTSVGIRAMHLVAALGYREEHLFGYDSSYAGDDAHAYQQVENESDRRIECFVGGHRFVSTPWMIRQADDFKYIAIVAMDAGVSLHVHGGGLLPMIAHEMANHDGVLRAVYDLTKAPASWDFTTWLVMAEIERRSRGYDSLLVSIKAGPNDGFRADKLPTTVEAQRVMLANVVKPAIRMVDADFGDHERGEEYPYTASHICALARRGVEIPKFKAPEWARESVRKRLGGRRPIVITLREAGYWENRNSNLSAWAKFAKEHSNVVIVRDAENANDESGFYGIDHYAAASLNINFRAALYEQAAVNLSVSHGPCNLLVFSDSPYLIFNMAPEGYFDPEHISRMTGLEIGGQWPWATKQQRVVWEPDSYETITREYQKFILENLTPGAMCAAD